MNICCCRQCTCIHCETLITRVFSANTVTAHYYQMQQLYDTLHLVKSKYKNHCRRRTAYGVCASNEVAPKLL
jgi:hypothetical protein